MGSMLEQTLTEVNKWFDSRYQVRRGPGGATHYYDRKTNQQMCDRIIISSGENFYTETKDKFPSCPLCMKMRDKRRKLKWRQMLKKWQMTFEFPEGSDTSAFR